MLAGSTLLEKPARAEDLKKRQQLLTEIGGYRIKELQQSEDGTFVEVKLDLQFQEITLEAVQEGEEWKVR